MKPVVTPQPKWGHKIKRSTSRLEPQADHFSYPPKVDKALLAARAAGVSAALFAPGWVFENPGEAGADFEHAQEKFWGLVQKSWPAARVLVRTLPFGSDFNQVRDEIFVAFFFLEMFFVCWWSEPGPDFKPPKGSSRDGHRSCTCIGDDTAVESEMVKFGLTVVLPSFHVTQDSSRRF